MRFFIFIRLRCLDDDRKRLGRRYSLFLRGTTYLSCFCLLSQFQGKPDRQSISLVSRQIDTKGRSSQRERRRKDSTINTTSTKAKLNNIVMSQKLRTIHTRETKSNSLHLHDKFHC